MYFALKLPKSFVDSLIEENPEIMCELRQGSYIDTYVRDVTIDAILKRLKMRSWPTYGEIRDDKTLPARFDAELIEKIAAIGGEYVV